MAIGDFLTDLGGSEIGSVTVGGTRYRPGDQVYNLSDIGLAMLLYQQGAWTSFLDPGGAAAAASAVAASIPQASVPPEPLEEIVVRASPPREPERQPGSSLPRDDEYPIDTIDDQFVEPGSGPWLPDVAFPAEPAAQEEEARAPLPIAPPVVRAPPAKAPVRQFGVIGLILGLVPAYMRLLGDVDERATESWRNRLKLPPRNPVGVGDVPDPFMYGRPDPWGILGPPLPDSRRPPSQTSGPLRGPSPVGTGSQLPDELSMPEVVITGRAPKPVPTPAPWFFPIEVPGIEAVPLPFEVPRDTPRPIPTTVSFDEPSTATDPDRFTNPWSEPVPDPAVGPRPQTPTRPPVIPSPFDPGIGGGPVPGLEPAPTLTPPRAPTGASSCSCPKPKKKKNSKDRTVCWGGTFIEKAKGLNKRRRYRVDCKTGKRIGSDLPKTPAPRRPKNTTNPIPPSWEVPQE